MGLGITTKKFALEIEELVRTKRLSYLVAIIFYCEERDIEPERISRFVGGSIKDKLQNDAEELNYLPKTNRLPL